MTFVAGKRARSVNFDSFAHITAVPVAAITATGIDFGGDLIPAESEAVWWFLTSRDDADETDRRNIAALLTALNSADIVNFHVRALLSALTDYVIGTP